MRLPKWQNHINNCRRRIDSAEGNMNQKGACEKPARRRPLSIKMCERIDAKGLPATCAAAGNEIGEEGSQKQGVDSAGAGRSLWLLLAYASEDRVPRPNQYDRLMSYFSFIRRIRSSLQSQGSHLHSHTGAAPSIRAMVPARIRLYFSLSRLY